MSLRFGSVRSWLREAVPGSSRGHNPKKDVAARAACDGSRHSGAHPNIYSHLNFALRTLSSHPAVYQCHLAEGDMNRARAQCRMVLVAYRRILMKRATGKTSKVRLEHLFATTITITLPCQYPIRRRRERAGIQVGKWGGRMPLAPVGRPPRPAQEQ